MRDLITFTDEDNKRLEQWTTGYPAYYRGHIEALESKVDHLQERILGLSQLLVQHGVCSVDDILDT